MSLSPTDGTATAAAAAAAAASAPGKVLLAGGYLVLDRAYTGLVFSLDARIHVCVQRLPTTADVSLSEVIVRSPQFTGAVWEYSYRQTEHDGGISITQLRAGASQHISRNPFVETTLAYALTYIAAVDPTALHPASVTILADDDYYSSPTQQAQEQQQQPPVRESGFTHFGIPLTSAHKTGLGSSAALVTALAAALLAHYLPSTNSSSLSTDAGKAKLHNLAQAAHCAAQGKIGSGFDVAAAVYGACTYRRFSPSILANVSGGEGDTTGPGTPRFGPRLKTVVDSNWDAEIEKGAVAVPQGLRLVMLDVDCGSQTPGMVRTLLKWRADKPDDAKKLWDALQTANEALAAELTKFGSSSSAGGGDAQATTALKGRIATIRQLTREMSTASGVPVEPPSQTRLLDDCAEHVSGVVGGVVPGAGGFDAVALLVEDREDVVRELGEYLASRQMETAEGEEGKGMGRVSLLGVREDRDGGVRAEEAGRYEHWVAR